MDAIIRVDAGQRIVPFNAAAERMFACPAAAAVGSPIDRFVPGSNEKAGPKAGFFAGMPSLIS